MSQSHKGLPVHGYTDQNQSNVDTVNYNKIMEERILRRLDVLIQNPMYNKRWLAISRTHIEEGFMAMNRAVFDPSRIELPAEEDKIFNS